MLTIYLAPAAFVRKKNIPSEKKRHKASSRGNCEVVRRDGGAERRCHQKFSGGRKPPPTNLPAIIVLSSLHASISQIQFFFLD